MLLSNTRVKARPRHDVGRSLTSSVLLYFTSAFGFYSVFFLSERVLAFFSKLDTCVFHLTIYQIKSQHASYASCHTFD